MHNHRLSSTTQCDDSHNMYCVFLHIVEGKGLQAKDDPKGHHLQGGGGCAIVLSASLDNVKFEIEGHSMETKTIFNNNCIWQCEMDDIKRMKTDNRPVKVICYHKSSCTEFSSRNAIGTLLLPLRGIQSVTTMTNIQSKFHWHKLGAVSGQWRANKPELYLLFVIIKKSVLAKGELDTFKQMMSTPLPTSAVGDTAAMLHSQSNIYVKLMHQVGLIQVGNNPDIDCDIFSVNLTFKQLRNLDKFLELDQTDPYNQEKQFVFHYELLGTPSMVNALSNGPDCYSVNDRLSVKFKSSLSSMRLYFQRIFFVPISLCLNEQPIATYCLSFDTLLPEEGYFRTNKSWLTNGSFHFDRLHKFLDPNSPRPTVDFDFSINLLSDNRLHKSSNEMAADFFSQTFGVFKNDNMVAFQNMNFPPPFMHIQNNVPLEGEVENIQNYQNLEAYVQMSAEPVLSLVEIEQRGEGYPIHSASEQHGAIFIHKNELRIETHCTESETKITNNAVVGSSDGTCLKANACVGTDDYVYVTKKTSSIGVNTESTEKEDGISKEQEVQTDAPDPAPETQDLAYKIVQELEAWKAQQMELFLEGLASKEKEFLLGLNQHWQHKRSILQARLEDKIAKVEDLNTKLEKAHDELNVKVSKSSEAINIANNVKNDIQLSYEKKFVNLEKQIKRLKHEMTVKGMVLEERNNEIKSANSRLETENAHLKQRLMNLEGQMNNVEKAYLPAAEIRDIVVNVREQNGRVNELEKTKNYYKSEWVKAIREMNKLKLAYMKHQQQAAGDKSDIQFVLSLEEILEEEKDALDSERGELRLVDNLLSASSDTSYSLGDD